MQSLSLDGPFKAENKDLNFSRYTPDVALHPFHLEYPGWYARVDIQPAQMVATRYALLQRAVTMGALVLLFHFNFPSIGYVVPNGDTWNWKLVTE